VVEEERSVWRGKTTLITKVRKGEGGNPFLIGGESSEGRASCRITRMFEKKKNA